MEMRLVSLILICTVAWVELGTKNSVAGISIKHAPRRRLSHRKIHSHKNDEASFGKSNNDGMKRSIYRLRIHYMPENDNIARPETTGRQSNKITASNRRSQNFFKPPYEKDGKSGEEQISNREAAQLEKAGEKYERQTSSKSKGGEQEMASKTKQKKSEDSGENNVIKQEVNKDQQQQKGEKINFEKDDNKQMEKKKDSRENKETSVKGDREKSLHKSEENSSKSESSNQDVNISKEHLHESEKSMSEQTAKSGSERKGDTNKEFRADKEGSKEWKNNEKEGKGTRIEKVSQEGEQSKTKNSRDEEMNIREEETKNITNGVKGKSNKTEVNEQMNERKENSKEEIRNIDKESDKNQRGTSKMAESQNMEDQTFDEDEKMGDKEREINNKGKYTTRGNKWHMTRHDKGNQKNVDEEKKLEREHYNMQSKGDKMTSKSEQIISVNKTMKANDGNDTSTKEHNKASQLLNNKNTAKEQNMPSGPTEVAGKERFSNSTKSTNKSMSSMNNNNNNNKTRAYNLDDVEAGGMKTQNNTNNTSTGRKESYKSSNSSTTRNDNRTATEEKKKGDEMEKGNWSVKEEGSYEPLEDKIKKADESKKGYKQRNEENIQEENKTTTGSDKEKGVNVTSSKGERNKGNKIDQSALEFGDIKGEMSHGDHKMLDNRIITEEKVLKITESNGRSRNERMLSGNLQHGRVGKSETLPGLR